MELATSPAQWEVKGSPRCESPAPAAHHPQPSVTHQGQGPVSDGVVPALPTLSPHQLLLVLQVKWDERESPGLRKSCWRRGVIGELSIRVC